MKERSEQEAVRFEKLQILRSEGFNYPNGFTITHKAKDVLSAELREGEESQDQFCIAGRLVQIRVMGKAAFAHVLDGSAKVQVYVKADTVGKDRFEAFKDFDLGDIVRFEGPAFITKTGETTLAVREFDLLSKCLIPLPEKWHGLSDIEARYRQRYVDLIANPEVREVFKTRAKIISYVRNFFDARDYVEVETPVLHTVAGGANAKPFVTHHNALDQEMFLRIALELPLKKLVVGGLERVYEIGRVFRNEGISKKHNPEFTMLEFYEAYSDYEKLMDLTEELIAGLVQHVCGKTKIKFGENEIDFATPWKRVSMEDSLKEIGGISKDVDTSDLQQLVALAKQEEIELTEESDWGRCIEDLWGELVEPKLVSPTFITMHPLSISPLARKNEKNPLVTDRFELIIAGMECANAFSELNDPQDQRDRFEEQARRKAAGDEEATDVEEDFLTALEYGLPPTGGEGIGIDRLAIILTDNHSIRDVLLFPQLKKRDEE